MIDFESEPRVAFAATAGATGSAGDFTENCALVAFDETAASRTRITFDLAMRTLRVTGLRRADAEGLRTGKESVCKDLEPATIPPGASTSRKAGQPRTIYMDAGPLAQESRTPTSIPVKKTSVDLME